MAIKNMFKRKQWKADYEAGRDAFNAGQFKAAETHLRSALGKAVELDDSSYGDTALLLGQVLRRLERYEESLEMTGKAFRYYQGLYGSGDARTVSAHLALVLADPGQVHDDPELRQATYHKAVEQFGTKSWQVVRTAALALVHLSSSEREKALGQAQDALSYVLGEGRQELGAWPPVAEEFSTELIRLGYLDLAARFMTSHLRVEEERYGDRSEQAAQARLILGELFLRNGQWSSAEGALSKALEQIKLKHGPRSEMAKRAVVSLGQALARQGRLEQAAPYLTESLEKLRDEPGPERLDALVWLLEYKCLLSATDAERGALWRELETAWEADPTEAVRTRIFEGFCAAQTRLQESWELGPADRFLQAVLTRVRAWRGPHHYDVARVLMDLGHCAALREDDNKALSYVEQSLALDEGPENMIRALGLYGELGERERSRRIAKLVQRMLTNQEFGVWHGRRLTAYSQALLKAGEIDLAVEQANAAVEQLPDSEQDIPRLVLAECQVHQGQWSGAERTYKQILPRLTEPVSRARAHLQFAWLLCQTGRFSEMQEALIEVQSLSSLRREHPLIIASKAVSAQGAFYSGNIYLGSEERDSVFAFLRKGQHLQTRRSLTILTMLEPFGQEEYSAELDVGTQVLAASRYPEAVCTVFPVRDAACVGLRHLTRALYFHGQVDLARERLIQYRQRFTNAYGDMATPLSAGFQLCAALLADTASEKIELLESARRSLRELGGRHVNLFPALSLLAEQYIETRSCEQAKVTIAEALAIRKSPRLKEWLSQLELGDFPSLSGSEIPSTPIGVETSEMPPSAPKTPSPEPQPPEPQLVSSETQPAALELPSGYLEPPNTEDECEVSVVPAGEVTPAVEVALATEAPATEVAPAAARASAAASASTSGSLDDSGTLVAQAGATGVNRIPMAAALSERDTPPSEEEVEAFLQEVQARFGDEREARQDALMMLSLLFPDGAELAQRLWGEALSSIAAEDFETLHHFEARARDANSYSLVLVTLQRRLADEVTRYGEQATESIETLTRMARAFETREKYAEAYQKVVLVTEILRSWFGARSRRLLEPLGYLIRLAEKLEDVDTALDHHLERHQLLETGQSSPEELFSSRIALLPTRALLGQVKELLEEAETSVADLAVLGHAAGVEFATALLVSASRLERYHWRVTEAVRLLDMALEAVSESEISLVCRLQLAYAECQARRDYRSQGDRLRRQALEKAAALDSEARAEIFHDAAESCLRVRELASAREIAERILEERIAGGGRKDQWAGRALLILAEADLKSYRLEGTETAIAMSRPSLEGLPQWNKALLLKSQSEFFLGREEEAYALLDTVPDSDALELRTAIAVWRGQAESVCAELGADQPTLLSRRWKELEKIPLEEAVSILELLARAGRIRQLQAGIDRLEPRLQGLLTTDVRAARVELLRAGLKLWERRWEEAERSLQRVLDVLPADQVEVPDGLAVLPVRAMLIRSLLAQGKVNPAQVQAKEGAAEAGELLGEEDLRSLAFRAQAAFCAEARGDSEEAMVLMDEILAPLQDRLGETHVLQRDIYRGLSRAFRAQGDLESASLTAEEALRIDKECRGLSLHLVEDLALLASIERQQDRAEARNLLDTALELATEVLPVEHPFKTVLWDRRQELGFESLESVVSESQESEPPRPDPASPQGEEAPTEPETSLEVEASLDGWTVVEDEDDIESSFEEFVEEEDDLVEESAEALFEPIEEEPVEDSVFETPVVDLGRGVEDSMELELTEEEAAELASVTFESDYPDVSVEAIVEADPELEAQAEPPLPLELEPTLESEPEPVGDLDLLFQEPLDSIDALFVEEAVPSEPAELSEEPETDPATEEGVGGSLFEDEPESSEEARAEDVLEVPPDSEIGAQPVAEVESEPELEIVPETESQDQPDHVELEPVGDLELAEVVAPSIEFRHEALSPLDGLPATASYHDFAEYYGSPRDSAASVELSPDFPPVPYRAPEISDEEPEEQESTSELGESPDIEEAREPVEVSVEVMARLSDPESWLLPLAPVFFLPIPWKEASEAAFDEDYELLHDRFQEQFNADGAWREVLDEAVSAVRQDPTPTAGYFLFLIGSQLERAGRLHTADLALATAIELLEHGPAFGAACHMAGRVAGRRGELRRALDYFERAAELAEDAELAVLKIDAAECHLGLGRPEEALIGFEEVFKYLDRSVPKVQFLAVAAKMAQIHLLIGDPDSSQAMAEDVLSRLSPNNSGTYRVLGRILLSRAFARLGRHELALQLAEDAWDGAKPWTAKRREGRRVAISNLVDIYSLVGRFEDAERMLRESGLVGWGLAESELLLRAGHVAVAVGKLEAARSYLRLGQSFLTRFRSPALWRSSFLELEAEIALQEGDPVRADQVSRQALVLFEQEATGPVDRSRHLVRAARIAAALGDLERARALGEEAHSLRDLHLGTSHPHTESVEGLAAVLG